MSADNDTERITAATATDATAAGLTRVTFNATARTTAALTTILAVTGDNKTDAINNSLRAIATLLALAHSDGSVHVIAPDGVTHVVHLP
ncbi:hypothetical protein [Solwaraspora sp. WMMA2065]|uniref:hypothetical protein n=1 Tax=Solwaraspora sp. WMMA2065 TaxID=3015166 RepID=UPI00259B8171|nr:hypothetical protein [Solwaraspora sp. WMMA2065]WJK33151.1 hypothetical protein O7610_20870 [Solwaraspora sp. WMMA2065]